MAKIPTFDSSAFTWTKRVGRTTLSAIGQAGFPASFYIRSARTGEVRLFLSDAETNEVNEFFDGEASAYFSPAGDARVQIWC